MTAPRISFTIPYYDNPAYLAEAIASVRAQTLTDWELVVVDDCGPAPAQHLVDELGDDRISYVRNAENLGLAGNWNECVRRATAPYVTILHADDRLLPRYGERVLAALEGRPEVAAAFTDAVIVDGEGKPTWTAADQVKKVLPRPRHDHDLVGDRATAGLLRGNYILCPSLCFRVDTVGRAPFETRWRFVPDWDITVRLLFEGHTLRAVREPLLEYRRHGGQQTSVLTENASRFVEEIEFLERSADRAAALGWTASERTARRRVTLRGHIAQKLLTDVSVGRFGAAREKARILRSDLRRDQRVGAHDPDPQ
jgi:glycosyltransferase involved in cell wall biosynthesis